MTDLAAHFRAMYLAHCEDCERAGLPMPTPEEWVNLVDESVRDVPKSDKPKRSGGAQ
ncbi:MAG: hypothetical protein U1F54_23090 [Burkholderiales bacterium]